MRLNEAALRNAAAWSAEPDWFGASKPRIVKQIPKFLSVNRTHGRIATYNAGCRCDECRIVATAKRRTQRACAQLTALPTGITQAKHTLAPLSPHRQEVG